MSWQCRDCMCRSYRESTGPAGAVTFSAEGVDPAQRNSAAVRYRLVLSEQSFMELEAPPLDLAQTLCDLRVPSRKELGAVRTLADALGYEDLKEMGRSPEGVRALLEYLDLEEAEGAGAASPKGFPEYSGRTP